MSATQFVKFNAIGVAKSVAAATATAAVKTWAENARSSISGSSSPKPIAKARGRNNTEILAYPFNVDEDEQQGHHIMFNIYTQGKGKLKTPKGMNQKTINEGMNKIGSDFALSVMGSGHHASGSTDYNASEDETEDSYEDTLSVYESIVHEDAVAAGNDRAGGSAKGLNDRSIQLSQMGPRKKEKTIALYMPPSVDVQYEVKYVDEEIGALAMAGNQIIQGLLGSGSTLTKLQNAFDMRKLGKLGAEGATSFLLEAADVVADGASQLYEINKGSVITPRMELMFEGVGRRNFTYTFVFIPKNQQESQVVEEIVYNFKKWMMPEYSNPSTRREMNIPATFEIDYYYRQTENAFLNKISTCFLKTVDVKYGADRYTTYEQTITRPNGEGVSGTGWPAQKTSMTLTFSELETLSRDHIEEGY